MSQKFLGIRAMIGMCLAIGWWDLWYPEIAREADVYKVVYEEGTVQKSEEVVKYEFSEYSFYDFLKMDSEQIQFRSRLLEWIEEYLDKG